MTWYLLQMCLREKLEPGDEASQVVSNLATAPATGVNERPSDIEREALLAPTLEAGRARFARLDPISDESNLET